MAIQYYNSLFPAITPSQLPSFDYIPRSRNEITNVLSYNSIKYTFYPSIANVRNQFKSVLVRVIRGDTNSNPLDHRIFTDIMQIPFKAVYNLPQSNEVGYDATTGEYHVNIPTKYLFPYGNNCVVNASGNLPSAAVGTLGYTLSDGKAWIRNTSSWVEIDEKNFDYTKYSSQNVYFKLQIRLLPYEIRLKSGTYNQWEIYGANNTWVKLDEQWLLDNRNSVSEYSSVTSIKPVYRPDLTLVGSFKSRDASGNWQQPYFNKDDIVEGDGINDSINIINSPFFAFAGNYNNTKDMSETLSKYQFKLYNYVNTNPYAGTLFQEGPITVVSEPSAPNIHWGNTVEFSADQKFWLELWGETKNGLQIKSLYILEAKFPPISGSIGFKISADNEYARTVINLDGRQMYFEPATSGAHHEFQDSTNDGKTDRAKIVGEYKTSKDIELEPEHGVWVAQMVVSGITPEHFGSYGDPKPPRNPFFTARTEEVGPTRRFAYKYEIRAIYNEMFEPPSGTTPIYIQETGVNGQPTDIKYKASLDGYFRLNSRRTWAQVESQQFHLVRDLAPGAEAVWGIGIDSNNRFIVEAISGVDHTQVDDYIYFKRDLNSIAIGIKYGRIGFYNIEENDLIIRNYVNQFELTKYIYDRNVDPNIYPDYCILKQTSIGKFTNMDGTMAGWSKIDPDNKYYFYFGDFKGTPYLYVKQLNGDSPNKIDLFNQNLQTDLIALPEPYCTFVGGEEKGQIVLNPNGTPMSFSIGLNNRGEIDVRPSIFSTYE